MPENRRFIVSSSPHVGSSLFTRRIMIHVAIALTFCLVAGVVLYGFYSFFLVYLAVFSALGAETLYNLIRKKPNTILDGSAIVTGMIVGLNLPPTAPFYVAIIGSFFAIMIVKMLFGGLGKNFANPAATARVFLLLAWTSKMTAFINPLDYAGGKVTAQDFFSFRFIVDFADKANYVTGATPLAGIKSAGMVGASNVDVNLLDLLFGTIGGSIGEVCAIAIIAAAIYLIAFKIIDWKIPTIYLASCALFTLVLYKNGWNYILPNLLSGGILFGAVFMLTDYASSPNTRWGTVIYAVGAGLITMLIRRFGGMNEGVSFAILLMNLLVPLIDKACRPKPFGYKKPPKFKKKEDAKNA
ncbi:MAG: RnfABCDGE type electron transport complex subunit D [Clostridia bacterium]|nr:RnfABCDGE type electron transport complex subunit D [Clostridia bacterium]